MIFNFDKIISYLSKFYSLKIGDLIYTGTPAGVSKVQKGDILNGFIGETEMFKVVVK
jgi:2-keto-4-pentenoate hydratase/2-oxohepta-3-ene-1,7-dioic acid hydratase in catechol pathway